MSKASLHLIAIVILSMPLADGARAQVSPAAYRVLGQVDLRQRGVNMVQGVEMNGPASMALDNRDGSLHLYVSDTGNNRILCWEDARSYQIGDRPALVLAQPGAQYSAAMGIGAKGLNTPVGVAVNPANGDLYVADYGNHRVVRFPSPFVNRSRIEPDAVYGQPGFTMRSTPGAGSGLMNRPDSLAFDAAGNLWVTDSGNHRVLRFPGPALDNPAPEADFVLGQHDFNSVGPNRTGTGTTEAGFDTPTGLAFDGQGNLYVSDFNNLRVLRFNAPVAPDQPASVVYGQPNFASRAVVPTSGSTLAGPMGLTVDSAGNLYAAIPAENRILMFAAGDGSGAQAQNVWGQVSFTENQSNASSFPYASAGSLASVRDVKVDKDGGLFAVDSGNNRVVWYARGSKAASQLWGQADFSSNGANQVKPASINAPFKMAIDYSQPPFALYVSDTNNNRVLVWKNAVRFRAGESADLVIGQPDFSTAIPNVDTRSPRGASRTSLAAPKGIALDVDGNLYVADSGNNRVLRYPRPVNQTGRIAAETVLGQPDFTNSVSTAVTPSSLRSPSGVSVGPGGDLFVADTGNNRVMQFPRDAQNGGDAIRVFGQPSFYSGQAPGTVSSQTLASPAGIYVDAASNLYVADTGANRIMIFANTSDAAPAGAVSSVVIGQDGFDSAAVGGGAAGLRAPVDVGLDSAGTIYVSDNGNNRVLNFPSLLFLPMAGGAATSVIGQPNLGGLAPNWNSTEGLATPEGLYSPLGVYVDRVDTLYIGDAGNNRVLHYLKPISVDHAANPQSGSSLARGGLAIISGTGLTDGSAETGTAPLPLALANREVALNEDVRAPLLSVSAGQIKFQVPSSAPVGMPRFAVRSADTGELLAGTAAPVATGSPGLYADDGKGQSSVLNQDGTVNGSSSPAPKGSVIKLFGTGQGPVSPPVADGEAAPGEPSASTVAVPTVDGQTCLTKQPSVCVAIGFTFGEIQFSGLQAGVVGTWQLNVKIPGNAPSGSVPVRAVINGIPSNIITVSIR